MDSAEVAKWRPFVDSQGISWDLSFLNTHEVTYVHKSSGKEDAVYKFIVTYSFHCFSKEYEHQSSDEKLALMYHSPKESRPFCKIRYGLAKDYLKDIILSLDTLRIIHAGYGSYAVAEVFDSNGSTTYYHVPFKVFREKKRFRIHVMSAYPVASRPSGGKVGFFTIAHNLRANKQLPGPHK